MIFDAVRLKKNAARSKIISALILVLISGFLVSIPVPAFAAACNPTSIIVGADTVVSFTTTGSCTWTVPTGVISARVLVVGGGASASAGIASIYWPAGGGGGEVKDQTNYSLTPGTDISLVIGTGGAATAAASGATGNNGVASTFGTIAANPGLTNVNSATSSAGAKGGVSGSTKAGGVGTGLGAGGGGGASAIGSVYNGGAGINSDISGATVGYGGGGAGGLGSSGTASHGGAVGYYLSTSSTATGNGTANTGGGGARATNGFGGAGGSGVVIIRYGQPVGTSLLSFDANNGTGTDASIYLTTGSAGVIPSSTNMSRSGFDFIGWNIAANGSGDSYALAAPITISVNTILYAQWVRFPGPSCAAGVGEGGVQAATLELARGGNGCVGISYKSSNGTYTSVSFNYTGADQSWTSPAGVTSLTFFLVGAGGGSSIYSLNGSGASAGFSIGTYSVSAQTTFNIIVGQGGYSLGNVSTYGGGGAGGGTEGRYGSGGGRSAIRLGTNASDLITAGGGGGGGYNNFCGGAGGGSVGGDAAKRNSIDGGGGTQSAGGVGGFSTNGLTGIAGSAYQGGAGKDGSGGGGGGYFGGGGGGDNAGGGGGSGFIGGAGITNGATAAGTCVTVGNSSAFVFSITYEGNQNSFGTVPSSTEINALTSTTTAANSGSLTKTDFTSAGWNTSADGAGINYPFGSAVTPSGNTTLYAQWDSTVTYNGNGQTSLIGTVPAATTAKGSSNTTLAAPTTLLRTNFIFDGWNTAADGSGTSYAAGLTTYSATGSRTLYAQWKASITFNGNTNTDGTAPAIVNATTSTISLPSNSGTLVKTGYQFSGWNTAANGSGTTYAAGDSYPIAGPATLYANWTPSNTGLTPSFNTNTNSPIGVVASTAYVINNVYTNNVNDLVLSQYADKIQIIATVPSGTLAITTTTNLTLPTGYQAALSTAAGTISFIGNLTDVNAALATLRYVSPGTAVNTTISVYAAYAGINGDYRYNPTTGSSYWRGGSAVVWADAYNPTTTSSNCGVSFNGMCGYMVVPNDVAETQWVASNVGTGWIGITDATQGAFKFLPNAPNGNGSASFTYFASGEGTMAAEQYLAIYYTNGYWVDLSTQSMNALYEFGGKSETPIFASLTRTITIGAIAVPSAPTLDSTSDTGTSSTDKITKDNTPTINIGGLSSGATVTLTATPASGTAVTCTFVASGTTGSCTFGTMLDGTYSIVATQTLGGTTTAGSTALASVQIDTARPTVTLSTTLANDGNSIVAMPPAATKTYTFKATFSENVTDLLISDITKNTASTGWVLSTTAFGTTSAATYSFTATNSTGAGGDPGKLILSILDSVAVDTAGNQNLGTTSDYVINTVITVTFTNLYELGLTPVVGGSGPASVTQATSGEGITLQGSGLLNRAGHTFAGWSTVKTGGSGAVLAWPFTPTVPIELYSSWTPNVYIVTFDANSGTGAPGDATVNYTYGTAGLPIISTYNAGTLAKSGYTFAGWSATSGGAAVTNPYVPAGSVILYARWAANSYAITYNSNGGSGTMANSAIVAGTAKALTASAFTRTGYTFASWNTLANGTGTSYAAVAPVTLYDNTILYEQWTAGTFTVAFASNTASGCVDVSCSLAGQVGQNMPNQTFTAGTAFTLNPDLWYKTGYTFAGWSAASGVQAVLYTEGQTVTLFANTTIYPQWTANVYTVTFDPNTGTGAASSTSLTFTYAGTAITLPTVGTLAKTGYTFGGWATTSTGTAVTSPYSPAATMTLYTVWTPGTYAVSFNANSGTGAMTNLSVTAGIAKAITSNTFAYTGYGFSGWNTAANGSGTAYSNAANITVYANATLYAQWSILLPAVPTLTVVAGNGGATITITSSQLATGSAGVPVTYTVTAFSAGSALGTCIVTAPATTCTVTGLINTTAYTFKAVATNTTGSSAASIASSSVTPAAYTVTYNVSTNGGTVTTSSVNTTFNIGTPVTLPTPTKDGYTFSGWYTAVSSGVLVGGAGSSYSPPSSLTLYTVWSANTYLIIYSGNGNTGGTAPSNGSYTSGGTAHPIATAGTLSKTGYDFGGWTTASDGSGTAYSSPATYSTSLSLSLFAKWNAVTYTVTYVAGGGSGSVPAQAGKTIGQTFTVAAGTGLTKSSFAFSGWTDGNLTLYLPGDVYTVASSNISLTAQWTAIQYVVIYDANGGTGTPPTEPTHSNTQTFKVAAGSSLTRSGYTFSGWSDGAASYATDATYTIGTSNIVLNAQWTPATYTITYSANGGTGSASRSSDSFVFGSPAISLPGAGTLAKAGYTFGGWQENTTALSGAYSPTGNVTLNAMWNPATYTITYNANGATGSPTGATTSFTTGTTGATLPNATGMTRDGFTFSGWSTTPTGSVLAGLYSPTESAVLYALWVLNTHTVTYLLNGGTGAEPAGETRNFTQIFSLATTTATKDGYQFAGWITGSSSYAAGAPFTMPDINVTFNAVWIQIFNVHYSLNGGTSTPDADQLQADGSTITLAAAATRNGYRFLNWINQAGVTGLASATGYVVRTDSYLLYAQWTPETYAISYIPNSGDSTPTQANVSFGNAFTLANAITRTGYAFTGWNDGTLTYGPSALYSNVTGAVTLTAQWSTNSYHVTYDLNKGTSSAITETDKAYVSTFNVSSTVPTRTGYTFVNWSDGTTTKASGAAYTMPAQNLVLTAQWATASYKVTYSVDGGSSTPPTQVDVAFGATFNLAVAATYSSHNFLGWRDGTNTLGAGATYTMGSADVTLTAVWSGATYAITYSINGGSGTTPTTQLSAPSLSVTLAASTGLTKTGYTFGGWNDGALTLGSSSSFTVPSQNTSLVAVWTIAVPGTPPAPTVVSSNSQATITIAAPTSGGAASSYTVTASPGGATCTVVSPATSCTITGLANGTSYTFTSTASNSTGSSSASPASSAVTPATVPDAPTNIVAIAGNTQASVSFTAPATNGSAITIYTVTSSPGGFTATGSASPIIVTGLSNGTEYSFTVIARNAIGNSSTSSSSNIVIPATIPDAPTINTASATSATTVSVSLSAPGVDGGLSIQNYTISVTPPSPGTVITKTVLAAEITSATTVTGLNPGVTYAISAVATNGVGAGALATLTSAVSTPAVGPAAPTMVSASGSTATTGTISLSAPTNTGGAAINGYVTTLTPIGGGAAVVITTGTSATSISATGLTPGTTYTVTSAATNSAGTGASSTSATFTTPLAVSLSETSIAPTVGSAITPIRTTITATGATGTTYSVNPSLPSGFTLNTSTGTITGTATAAIAATLYTITASTTISGGATATGIAQVTIGVGATVPGAPVSVNAAASSSTTASVTVGASTVTGGATITGYTITATPPSPGTPVTKTVSDLSGAVTVTGLAPATGYTISVVANNSVGPSIARVDDSSITTSNSPPVLASISPSSAVNTGGVTITLTGTGFTEGATVTIGGQVCTSVVVISSTSITCVTPAGTTGSASIIVTNSDAQSSTLSNAFTNSPARPNPPTSLSAQAGDGSAFITFTPNSDGGSVITNYYYSTDGTNYSALSPVDKSSPATIPGLTNGTTYTIYLKAINAIGLSEASASVSVTPTDQAPPILVNKVLSADGTTLTLTYNEPLSATTAATSTYAITADGNSVSVLSAIVSGSTVVLTLSPTIDVGAVVLATYTDPTVGNDTNAIQDITGNDAASFTSLAVTNNSTHVTAPGTPPTPSAVAGDGQATVTVAAPTSGGTPTSLTVAALPQVGGVTKTCSITGASGTCVVNGLTNGTAYTFTSTATNVSGSAGGTSAASSPSSSVTPSAVPIAPIAVSTAAPTGTPITGSTLTSAVAFSGTPTPTLTYVWQRCTSALATTCSEIAGETNATYVVTTADEGSFLRTVVTATNTEAPSGVVGTSAVVPVTTPVTTPTPTPVVPTPVVPTPVVPTPVVPTPVVPTPVVPKPEVPKPEVPIPEVIAAAKAAVEKVVVDTAIAVAAAKVAVEKAAAAAVAQAAADTAVAVATAKAKAAIDAQAAAVKAAADAATTLNKATTTAAAKATATTAAASAAKTAVAAVQESVAAAKTAATAKVVATNATKQVDIEIGALASKTASAANAAQANAIATAVKAAANATAKNATVLATAAKATAAAALKDAEATAARISTEQKQAAEAAVAAKAAADADLKASAAKIAAATEAQKAAEAVVTALNEKVALAEESVKAADIIARAVVEKQIEDLSAKISVLQATADEVIQKASNAIAAQEVTKAAAVAATAVAAVQAAEAVAVKSESLEKTTIATKAAADASLAAKVASAAVAAAAKVPAKALIAPEPSTPTKKNSAKATITGLKPGQKIKVTINVKGK